MERQVVSSSTLRSIGYDPDGFVLEVEFRSRRVYRYAGVSAAVHDQLTRAASKGRYFNCFIRGRYPSARIA